VIQEFEGTSWVGLVPFRMESVMRRSLPDLPWISAFPELNLRLYVEHEGKPGIWFLSLDAANPLAVFAARKLFGLPYHWARMRVESSAREIRYRSVRRSASEVDFRATYGPTAASYETTRGTLEHWLTERYCLYARASGGRLYRTEIHHRPWPLQPAVADIGRNGLFDPHGIHCDGPPTLLHFSERLDVLVWAPTPID